MTEQQLCDGCNVRQPWEHRCHGADCNCDSPICMEKQGRLTHDELMQIVNAELNNPNSGNTHVVGSASRPKSLYEMYWYEFMKSNDYKGCVEAMGKKGMVQPYIDNILRYAFDAGYRTPKV